MVYNAFFFFVENVVSGTEVTDFQSLIFDYRKKWSPLENACNFRKKFCLLLLDMLMPNVNVNSFLFTFFFTEQLVTVQLANIYECFLCLFIVLGARDTSIWTMPSAFEGTCHFCWKDRIQLSKMKIKTKSFKLVVWISSTLRVQSWNLSLGEYYMVGKEGFIEPGLGN